MERQPNLPGTHPPLLGPSSLLEYDGSTPASLIVFQDGRLYLDPDGAFRAGVVMDNLMHRSELPVTIGVFVDPGEPDNRNAEYDAFDDAYAMFLLTEILPNVRESYAVTDNTEQWAIVRREQRRELRPHRRRGCGAIGSAAWRASSAASFRPRAATRIRT